MAGLRGLLALAACLLGGPAAAQQAVLEPSAAQLCLSHGGAKGEQPEYPLIAFKSGWAGRVTVALRFTGPTLRPAVTVLAKEGNAETIDSFVESVDRFVRAYRVPCLAANAAPVELVFDFVFRPDDRQVHWLKPQDADAGAQRGQLACLVHQSGQKGPEYPYDALRLNVQGRVLLRLRFEAADQPPVAEVGSPDPAPRPLLDWLAQIELKLSDAALDSVFADFAVITVPCMKINLNPQE